MAIFLAVDAGGTKTDYLLADEQQAIARVRGGTIKRMRVSAEMAEQNLEQALGELTAHSGLALGNIASCCIGTAGNTVPLVTDWLRVQFSHRVGGLLTIVGDVEIALDAAFRGGPGLLVLSGTGSNVAGRAANGEILTAGGWGPLMADQASGHRIGQEGVRAAFLALDEERETKLLGAVMEFWNLHRLDDLIAYANATPAPDFSQLAPLVASCAAAGELVAQEVLAAQGREMGYLVRTLMRRLRRHSGDAAFTPEIAFAGSVVERMAAVRAAILADVRTEFPAATEREGVVDPIQGALWQARGK